MSASAHRRIAALASDRAVHRAFQWLHLHEPQLGQWHREFLPLEAPSFGEGERAAWFLHQFRALGLACCRLDREGNVLGEFRSADIPAEPGPCVLLSAHLDTVFPHGTGGTPRLEGTRLYAPGACDNGAGLTALLGLAAALRAAELQIPCTILFAANVGEEGEGDLRGMRHLFREPLLAGRIQYAIALEGSGTGTVVDRALGSRRLRISVAGPGGHSWADADLPNPIIALSAALVAVDAIPRPESPRTTLNCGVIRGGTSVNSVPASVSADLDLRSVSGIELDRLELAVLQQLQQSMERSNLKGRVTRTPEALKLSVTRIGDRPAASLARSSALMQSLLAVDRHLGILTESRIGSTDANLPLSLGVPALAIGAGGTGGGIHTLGEWYDPTGRELALRRVLLLLLDTCSLAATPRTSASVLG